MDKNKTLLELFSFPGFKAKSYLKGKFGDHKARIVMLTRQKKLQNAQDAVNNIKVSMTEKNVNHATLMLQTIECMYAMKKGVSNAQSVTECA
jgi:hypothetical protein